MRWRRAWKRGSARSSAACWLMRRLIARLDSTIAPSREFSPSQTVSQGLSVFDAETRQNPSADVRWSEDHGVAHYNTPFTRKNVAEYRRAFCERNEPHNIRPQPVSSRDGRVSRLQKTTSAGRARWPLPNSSPRTSNAGTSRADKTRPFRSPRSVVSATVLPRQRPRRIWSAHSSLVLEPPVLTARSCFSPQDQCHCLTHCASVARDKRGGCIRNLSPRCLAAQLAHGLDHVGHPTRQVRLVKAQLPAMGVQRIAPVRP